MKVFYSWQADLPRATNKNLILTCLEKAAKEINRELNKTEADPTIFESERVEIDHDTKNVPGTPDIVKTIFDKVEECDVFVSDATFVGETINGTAWKQAVVRLLQMVGLLRFSRPQLETLFSIKMKAMPNPNVCTELGFAFSELGSDRIILVLNTKYGQPSELPFDLVQKRFPVTFNSDDPEAKTVLLKGLKSALKEVFQHAAQRRKTHGLSGKANPSEIMKTIMQSDSKKDWETKSGSCEDITLYKHDVNLRFVMSHGDESTAVEDFKEPWANQFPDPHASSFVVNLYYNSTLIQRYFLVSVDGARAWLPMPESSVDLRVTPERYKVAQILDRHDQLDGYMHDAKISLTSPVKGSGLEKATSPARVVEYREEIKRIADKKA